LPRLFM